MPKYAIDRRNLMRGSGAAMLTLAWSGPGLARPSLAPGGFSASRLAGLPKLLQSYVDDGSATGFVTLLYRKGEIAQVNTVGFQDREAGVAMKRDTIFRLASMTKPITCVAALTLVDQGKIGLNEPIGTWIPELANPRVLNDPNGPLDRTHAAPRPITLADLLTHRAGIAGQTATGQLAAAMGKLREGDPTFDTWFQRLGALPLAYDPGSTFNYGTSHDVLAGLVQRITGMPFADYLKQAIFDPLGMKGTAFWVPREKQGRIAAIYQADPQTGRQVPVSRPVPAAPTNFVSGAGGLLSTADDYLQFARMLLGKGALGDVRILSRPTVATMCTNWLTPEQRDAGFVGNREFWASQGYGLGVSITDDVSRLGRNGYTSKGSFGWPGSTGVWWRADPAEDMVAIYLVQAARDIPSTTIAQQPGNASLTPPAAAALTRLPATTAFINAAYAAIES